jgi:large subunit ribosomal protein L30e
MVKKRTKDIQTEELGVDLEKHIAMVVATGKIVMGSRIAIKESRGTKLVALVVSENCPTNIKMAIKHNCSFSKIPIIEYSKSSVELGAAIGRPHKVATIAIYDPGNSKILDFAKNKIQT